MRVERIGSAVLYLGDCREVLPTLERVDAVVTDPPFGVGNFVQITGNLRGEEVTWNDAPPDPEIFALLREISDHRIIWGANFFNCFEEDGGAIVWDKNQPIPNFSKCEIASCSHLKKTEMVRILWSGGSMPKDSDHPCERPVGLYRWCINYLPNPRTILDPFMGSGSCGVAAIKLGRSFVGIEREPRYFDIACKRIEAAHRQKDLFIHKPEPIREIALTLF